MSDRHQSQAASDYADLVKELHQAADEYDRGHGPLHAAAANAIDHLMTLIRLMQPRSGVQTEDVRWGVNVLLETIAQKFEAWDTYDLWRSDAAATVRGFKHAAPSVSSAPSNSDVQSASEPSTREVLDDLADKVSAKIVQLEHYKEHDCQLDHARIIAEGRISQANQILHWIAETAVQFTSPLPSAHSRSDK